MFKKYFKPLFLFTLYLSTSFAFSRALYAQEVLQLSNFTPGLETEISLSEFNESSYIHPNCELYIKDIKRNFDSNEAFRNNNESNTDINTRKKLKVEINKHINTNIATISKQKNINEAELACYLYNLDTYLESLDLSGDNSKE